ncbi:MAG: hypothetical protein KIT36_12020 [Alphaproteobacteria bacterium]|nr:hypothetical protein [Alphaproteobacteria bacterium]
MRNNAVVVAADEAFKTRDVLQWLEADDVRAYGSSDHTALDMVRELRPRVVVCSDGPDGIAFCHAVRELPEPPMIVVLSEDPTVNDDVYFDGLTVIALVRAPVRMAALSRFISTALQVTARLDNKDRPADATPQPEGLLFHIGHQPRVLH